MEHIAFNVSRATFTLIPGRLEARGITFLERDGSPATHLDASALFGALVMVAFERIAFEPGTTIEQAVDAVVR